MVTRTRTRTTETKSIEDKVEVKEVVQVEEKVEVKEIEDIEPYVELKEEEQKEIVELSPPQPKVITWKKIGGGALLLNNRYIKPGQIFTATIEEIPTAFRDVVVPTDDLPSDKLLVVKSDIKYTIKRIGKTETYNIVSADGKVLNELPLTKVEAENILKAL